MARFEFSRGGRQAHEPWFHIGSLGVTTTWFVVLASVVGIFLFAGGSATVTQHLVLFPDLVVGQGKVWTILTWPFAYVGIDFWAVATIFFFWYFGTELEGSLLGRKRFAWLLTTWTLILGVLLVLLHVLTGLESGLATLSMLELMVVLAWIAEWPDRKFLFNVPAWLFGLVIVGIQVLTYLGNRQWLLLLNFAIGIALCAIAARSFGMLSERTWIPRLPVGPGRRPKAKRGRSGKGFDPSRPSVVQGPWSGGQPAAPAPSPAAARDERRMDELLDKIHAQGVDSLSAKERAELEELRLRRGRR